MDYGEILDWKMASIYVSSGPLLQGTRMPNPFAMTFAALCVSAWAVAAQATLPFQGTVQNLFQSKCMTCHATTLIQGRYLMLNDSVWVVTNRQYLLQKITPQSPLGPIKSLSAQDMAAIRDFLTSASATGIAPGTPGGHGNREGYQRASRELDFRWTLSKWSLLELDILDGTGKRRTVGVDGRTGMVRDMASRP